MSESELDQIKVLLVGQNKNINVVKVPIKENKAVIAKDKFEPFFDADCIFQIKEICQIPLIGKFITNRRKREACLIQQIGKEHAEKLKAPGKDDLFEPLTNEERKDLVKREIAKALRKFQPFSNVALIIIVILLIANLILGIMGLKGVHI